MLTLTGRLNDDGMSQSEPSEDDIHKYINEVNETLGGSVLDESGSHVGSQPPSGLLKEPPTVVRDVLADPGPDEPQSDDPRQAQQRSSEQRIVREMDEVSARAAELSDTVRGLVSDQVQHAVDLFAEQVEVGARYVSQLVSDAASSDEEVPQQAMLSATMTLRALEEDAAAEDARVGDSLPPGSEAGTKVARIFGVIMGALKRAGRHLLVLISGLMKPKSWTLKGELGLTFLGKTGIEITFGA